LTLNGEQESRGNPSGDIFPTIHLRIFRHSHRHNTAHDVRTPQLEVEKRGALPGPKSLRRGFDCGEGGTVSLERESRERQVKVVRLKEKRKALRPVPWEIDRLSWKRLHRDHMRPAEGGQKKGAQPWEVRRKGVPKPAGEKRFDRGLSINGKRKRGLVFTREILSLLSISGVWGIPGKLRPVYRGGGACPPCDG